MNQLSFEFGPEHPRNEKGMRLVTLIRKIRNEVPLSLASMMVGVQPMISPTASIFTIKARYREVPPPELFELTRPLSERDWVGGCFGPNCCL